MNLATAQIHFLIDPQEAEIGHLWPREELEIRKLTPDFQSHIIRGRGHAEWLARRLISSNARLIVCLGGDRLVHEVINVALSVPRLQTDICLHHRHYKGNLHLYRPPSRGFHEFLEGYLKGERREVPLDLGAARYVGDFGEGVRRYFFSHVSFGIPSVILKKLPQQSNRVQAFRVLLRTLPFYRAPAVKVEVSGRDQAPQFLWGGFVQNLPFATRGIRVCQTAKPDDSLLEVLSLQRASWFKTIRAASRLLFKDELKASFIHRESARHLKIESTSSLRNVRIEIDGESFGFLPLETEILPARLKILE